MTQAKPGLRPPSQIELRTRSPILVENDRGAVHCVVGYTPAANTIQGLPYYAPEVALRDAGGMASDRFVFLEKGTLYYSEFLRDGELYRVIEDRHVTLPTGAFSYFGVRQTADLEEDADLTRAVFGASFDDLTTTLEAWGRVTGRHEMQTPRVTFSRTRENTCDLTGAMIPREFPYVAFAGAQQHWGHVSLLGVYRLLALECANRPTSRMAKALVSEGADIEVISQLLSSAAVSRRPIPARS